MKSVEGAELERGTPEIFGGEKGKMIRERLV